MGIDMSVIPPQWPPIGVTDETRTSDELFWGPSSGTAQQIVTGDVEMTLPQQETDMSSLSLPALRQEIASIERHLQDTPNAGFSTLRAALDHHLVRQEKNQ